jgi:hypothetical protein
MYVELFQLWLIELSQVWVELSQVWVEFSQVWVES